MFGLYLDAYQAVLLTVKENAASASIRGYALVNFYDYRSSKIGAVFSTSLVRARLLIERRRRD